MKELFRSNNLLICLILISTCNSLFVLSQRVIYVDSISQCSKGCGDKSSPFSNIKDAIDYLENTLSGYIQPFTTTHSSNDADQIVLLPGHYKGLKNTNIVIKKSIHIISNEKIEIITSSMDMDTNQPVIDCQGVSNGISIINALNVKLENIGIHNCVGVKGSGLFIEDSEVNIIQSFFFRNVAELGGAIYSKNSKVSLTRTSFIENNAKHSGAIIYGIAQSIINFFGINPILCPSDAFPLPDGVYVGNSIVLFSSLANIEDSTDMAISAQCDVGSALFIAGSQVGDCLSEVYYSCSNPSSTWRSFDYEYLDSVRNIPPTCNNNYQCETGETCLSCPTECSCSFNGWRLDTWYDIESFSTIEPQDASAYSSHIAHPDNMLGGFKRKSEYFFNFHGKFSSYFNVKESGKYIIRLVGKNLGVDFKLNNAKFIKIPFSTKFNSTKEFTFSKDDLYKIVMIVQELQGVSEIQVYLKHENDQEFELLDPFYSLNVCGDNLLDKYEKDSGKIVFCPSDKNELTGSCGDDICNENPDDCFIDCYSTIAERYQCPEQAPAYQLDNTYSVGKDFVGSIVNNQYLFSLPGLQLLSHGVDIVTDKFLNSPIFQFGYCDNTSFSTIHDSYRGLVYSIPEGVYAIPVPKCSYQSTSDSFSTSSQMASQMSKDSGLSVGLDVGGSGWWGISFGAKVAFSQESSVNSAKEMEQSKSGSIVVTKVECETTKVHIDEKIVKFHKNFLRDLANAKTISAMKFVVKKYGNVYIKSANMGGRLSSVTVVDHSFMQGKSSQEISKHVDLSFSAQVSSPILNVDVDASIGIDNKINSESQNSFESESSRSTIQTYGGPNGAFGPDENGSNNFGEWAKKVDLIPVPIKKQYGFINDLIPENWKLASGDKSIKQLWYEAEIAVMYASLAGIQDIPLDNTIYYLNCPGCLGKSATITLNGNYNDVFNPTTTVATIIAPNITITLNEPFTARLMEITSVTGLSTQFEIIDIVNSRTYYFGADTLSRGTYAIRLEKPKIYKCHGSTATVPCSTSVPALHITLLGKLGTLEFVESSFNVNGANKFIHQNNEYIGELQSITLSLKPRFTDDLLLLNSFEFPSISVSQGCPNEVDVYEDNGLSKCSITKNIPLKQVHSILYSTVNKTPAKVSVEKSVTKSLSTKRLTPLPKTI